MNITRENILNRKHIVDIANIITEKQLLEIDNVCRFYNSQTIRNRIINIVGFIKNGVEDHWAGRMRIIQTKLKNDCFSEYALKIKFGINWEIVKKERYNKVDMSLESFIKRYGKDDGVYKWALKKEKNKTFGLKYAIQRYGADEGKKRWEATLKRKINTMQERKKYISYRNGRTLIEYQNKYGPKLGYEKWLERNRKQSYRFSKKYYIKVFGYEEGMNKWMNYRLEMNKTSLSSFIKRYGEIDGELKYQDFLLKTNFNKKNYSKISQDLFWKLFNVLDVNIKKCCYFAELNGEHYFYVNQPWGDVIFVDFKLNDKIIEFDGNYWHSNKKQQEKDKLRDEFLSGKGYHILRIPEKGYKQNKEIVINECLIFLNK